METIGAQPEDLDLARQLRELERAEAVPYVVYPPTPWWYEPTMGMLFAAIITFWSNQLLDRRPVLYIVAIVVMAASGGAVIGFIRTRYGALPKLFGSGKPPEVRRLYRRYLLGYLIVVALLALVWWAVGPYAAAAAAFVLVTVGLALYERCYARVAALMRERLGIDDA